MTDPNDPARRIARIRTTDGQRIREAFTASIVFANILLLLGGIAWYYDGILYWLPLVNSAALLAMLPDSLPARPRSIVAGHAITATIGGFGGMLCAGSILAALGAAVTGVFFMTSIRAPHPPAAITALVLVLHPVSTPWHLSLLMAGVVALGSIATVVPHVRQAGSRAFPRAGGDAAAMLEIKALSPSIAGVQSPNDQNKPVSIGG